MRQPGPVVADKATWTNEDEGGRSRFVDKQSSLLQSLLETYRAADALLAEFGGLKKSNSSDQDFQAVIHDLMGQLLESAMNLRAVDAQGIAAKLQLWRHDDVDLPIDPSCLNRAQRLVLSLVRDLEEVGGRLDEDRP